MKIVKEIILLVSLCASLTIIQAAQSTFEQDDAARTETLQAGVNLHQLIAEASSVEEIKNIESKFFKDSIEPNLSLLKIFAIKYEELQSNHLEKDLGCHNVKDFEDAFLVSLQNLNGEKADFLYQNVWPYVTHDKFQEAFRRKKVQRVIKAKIEGEDVHKECCQIM